MTFCKSLSVSSYTEAPYLWSLHFPEHSEVLAVRLQITTTSVNSDSVLINIIEY